MLRKMSSDELKRRALRRLKRNKASWWRPEIIRLNMIEGKLTDILALIGSISVSREIDYMLSVLTEGGWISMELQSIHGDIRRASILHPTVLEGRNVSIDELKELSKRKYEAILRFKLAG